MVLTNIAEKVNNNPKSVIFVILAVTIFMFGIMATSPAPGVPSQAGFIPDNEVVDAMTDIGEKFSTEYPVVTLIRNDDDDILTSSVFVDIVELEIAFIGNEEISKSLIDQETKSNSIVSLPNLLASQFNVSTDDLNLLKQLYENKTDS